MTTLTYAHLMGLPKTLATKAKTIQPKAQKLADLARAAIPKRASSKPDKPFAAMAQPSQSVADQIASAVAKARRQAIREERERFGAAVRLAAVSATTRDDLITASGAAAAGYDPIAVLESLAQGRAAAAAAPGQTRSFNRN